MLFNSVLSKSIEMEYFAELIFKLGRFMKNFAKIFFALSTFKQDFRKEIFRFFV